MRSKFSQLEKTQRVWTRLVEDYYNKKDPRINSAPDMFALQEKKRQIFNEIKTVENLIHQLYLVDKNNKDLDLLDKSATYENVNVEVDENA